MKESNECLLWTHKWFLGFHKFREFLEEPLGYVFIKKGPAQSFCISWEQRTMYIKNWQEGLPCLVATRNYGPESPIMHITGLWKHALWEKSGSTTYFRSMDTWNTDRYTSITEGAVSLQLKAGLILTIVQDGTNCQQCCIVGVVK
jgi:hypothetical protein